MKSTLLLILAAVGCGSADTTDPLGSGHGTCSQRVGTYALAYVERQGNCGAGSERVFLSAKQPVTEDLNADGCTGAISYSGDNCEVTYSSTCPEDGVQRGGKLSISGTSKWNVAATYGTAIEEWTLARPDGTTLCRSTYDVTANRR
jgi:hypothetical protein